MPNVGQMLRSMVKQRGVGLHILQKDYAISYLLAGIARTSGLGEQVALKGGTALRKLYYADYRFSEDLDYSTLEMGVLPNGDDRVRAAVARMAGLLQERGPFEVECEALTLRLPHPGHQMAYIVRVRFPDQRVAMCRLKVEITVDEGVLLRVREHPILHGFPEPFEAEVRAYALEEIVAEKLRALLQSRDSLAKRGWGASRVCRDYYDLWWILSREQSVGIPALVAKKCAERKVSFQSAEEFTSPSLIDTARREWDRQLSPFLAASPDVERVLAEVGPLIAALFREG